jgi:hypothetical protein
MAIAPSPASLALGTAVTLYGTPGSFGTLGTAAQSASGHSFTATGIPGWGFAPGLQVFYTRGLPDGQIAISTLPFTNNELQSTSSTAELAVFHPNARHFYRIRVHTSAGALNVVTPGKRYGSTDTGSGDMVVVNQGGVKKLLATLEGYYFNWDISRHGLYPVLAFFQKLEDGKWHYDLGASLNSNQWQATNPAAYSVIAPSGQVTGMKGQYWPTRQAGQMAVLPQSGRVVTGHYFGTGSFKSGVISVSDSSGNLLTAYQVPNITPASGTITLAAVRDVQADPSSVINDERFVVIYDAFGTGVQICFQEFSYDDGTQVITPMSVPVCPADTTASGHLHPDYSFFAHDGTLYIATSSGFSAGNLQVFINHPGTGRNLVSGFPASGNPSWATNGAWPTPCKPDYSLGFPVQQGLGFLDGPLAEDRKTGAVLAAGTSGKFSAAVPDSTYQNAQPNLLTSVISGLETPNLLSKDDQIFASSLGTWVAFLALVSRVIPPVAPPAGIFALKMLPAFSTEAVNTGNYAVSPNTSYEMDVWFLAGSASRTCEAWVQWQTATGTVISNTAHATVTDTSGSWTQAKAVATSPANAAVAVIFAQADSPGSNEAHYIASNGFFSLSAQVAGWTGFLTTVAITSSAALDGSFSLAITAPFNSEVLAASSPLVAVIPGREYLAKASFLAAATPQSCQVQIAWFDSGQNPVSTVPSTLTITDSTSSWTESWCGYLAPQNAAYACVVLAPATTSAGETHYADRISFTSQAYTPLSTPADFGVSALRASYGGSVFAVGRPSVVNRVMWVPIAQGFSPAEQAAYLAGGYVPAGKPQFLAALDLVQLLSNGGLAIPPLVVTASPAAGAGLVPPGKAVM